MSSATTAGDLDVHVFLGDGTTLVDLGTLGGPSSETVAINAADRQSDLGRVDY